MAFLGGGAHLMEGILTFSLYKSLNLTRKINEDMILSIICLHKFGPSSLSFGGVYEANVVNFQPKY